MDSLVAQYSRPIDAEEGQTEEQQLELYSGAPELSLKFALPPVAQVWHYTAFKNKAILTHSHRHNHGSAQ